MNIKRVFAVFAAAVMTAAAVTVTGGGMTASAGITYDSDGLYIENTVLRSVGAAEKSVNVPGEVTKIATGAFSYCKRLEYVTIPRLTTVINASFGNCPKLIEIDVDDENEKYSSIDGVLFNKDADELIAYPIGRTDETYTVPYSVKKINSNAFSNCIYLKNIVIPEGVTVVGGFSGCTSLESVTLPRTVKEISSNAFSGCTSLKTVNIPKFVMKLGSDVFAGCTELTGIDADSESLDFASVDGVLFSYDMKQLIQYPIGKTGTSYSIPDSVSEIGSGAFAGCTSLTSVTIPNDGRVIGKKAFSGCTSLKKVTVPKDVREIGDNAFSDCTSLISVTVLGDPEIGTNAFVRGMILYGGTGTNVEKYAKDNAEEFFFNFIPINNLSGDADDDGVIGLNDVTAILSHYVGSKLLTGNALKNADANNDGKVDLADVICVLKLYVGA